MPPIGTSSSLDPKRVLTSNDPAPPAHLPQWVRVAITSAAWVGLCSDRTLSEQILEAWAFGAFELVERAGIRVLVGSPAFEPGRMTEAVAGQLVVADLHNNTWPDGHP